MLAVAPADVFYIFRNGPCGGGAGAFVAERGRVRLRSRGSRVEAREPLLVKLRAKEPRGKAEL